MTQLQYKELDLCRLIVKLDLGLASSWLFPSINFQFRTETFLSIFLGCQEWPARFWEVQAVGNVVKMSIQQRWESENKHPRKPLQNHRYADLWAKRPKEMVSGRHIKDTKNGKQVNFSFSKSWWASKVSLLAVRNDCVARSYRFSVPLTCTRAIIRQKVYWRGVEALCIHYVLLCSLCFFFSPSHVWPWMKTRHLTSKILVTHTTWKHYRGKSRALKTNEKKRATHGLYLQSRSISHKKCSNWTTVVVSLWCALKKKKGNWPAIYLQSLFHVLASASPLVKKYAASHPHASPSWVKYSPGTPIWSVRSRSFRVVIHSPCNYIEKNDRPTMTDAQSAEEYFFLLPLTCDVTVLNKKHWFCLPCSDLRWLTTCLKRNFTCEIIEFFLEKGKSQGAIPFYNECVCQRCMNLFPYVQRFIPSVNIQKIFTHHVYL